MAKIYGQLEKAQLENTTSDATNDPKGMMKYRTDQNVAKVSDGSTYKEIADTSTSQTLANKSFTFYDLIETTTPSNPASGRRRIYNKNNGNLYSLDSLGVETLLNGGGGGGGSGGAGVDTYEPFLVQKKQSQTFSKAPNTNTIVDAFTENAGLTLNLAKPYATSDGTTIYLHENVVSVDEMDAVTGWTSGTNTPTIALDTTNKIEETGSVSMSKASLNGTITMFKTLNFSMSRRAFRAWVRLDTVANLHVTNAFRIYLESSVGNNKAYTFPASRFTAGQFVLLECDEVDGVATGTPNMGSITKVTFELTTTSAQTITANVDYLVTVTNQDLVNSRYAGLTMPIWDATNQEFLTLVSEDATEKGKYTMASALANNYAMATTSSKDYGLTVTTSAGLGSFETASGAHAKTQYVMNRQILSKSKSGSVLQTKIGVSADSFEVFDSPSGTTLRISGDYSARFKSGDKVVLWYMGSESFTWLTSVQGEFDSTWNASYIVLTLSINSTYSAPYTTLTFSSAHSVSSAKNLWLMRMPIIAKGFVGTSTANEVLTDLTFDNFYPSGRQQLFFDNFNRANNTTSVGGSWAQSVSTSEASGFEYGINDNSAFTYSAGGGRWIQNTIYPTVNNTIKQKFFEVNYQVRLETYAGSDNGYSQFSWNSTTNNGMGGSVSKVSLSTSGIGTNLIVTLQNAGSTLVTAPTLINHQMVWLNVKIVVRDTSVFVKVWKVTDPEPSTWNIAYTSNFTWSTDRFWGFYNYCNGATSGAVVRIDNFLLTQPENNGFQFLYADTNKTGSKMVIAAALDRQDTTNELPAIVSVMSTLV